MTYFIVLAVVLGGLTGRFILPPAWYEATEPVLSIGLCLLLLFVGMDLGKQRDLFKQIKKVGWHILLVPAMIGIGSIAGTLAVGPFLNLLPHEASAVGAGFGWYSLSAILMTDYSEELSAIAFMTNVIREVLAILLLPFLAKYIGFYEAVAPCGATSMDTTLPLITRYTDAKTAVVGFVSGVVLSFMVPFLVPLFLGLGV